jgi:hypothetical protein
MAVKLLQAYISGMNIKARRNIKLQHCKCGKSAVRPSDEIKSMQKKLFYDFPTQ